ncbi:MAG: hypothetical protein K8R21_15295 [Leptospira sp.]|nr:hypothetical protein [Leptospira sp.]
MSVYRINVFNSFENVIWRKAFSVPNRKNSISKGLEDHSGWDTVEKINKGNVILLCRGIRNIWAVAIAEDDCRITDVDSFKDVMKYKENGFRYVTLELYREFKSPIDGKTFFEGLLKEKNPFEDDKFCVELIPEKKLKDEFVGAINYLLAMS